MLLLLADRSFCCLLDSAVRPEDVAVLTNWLASATSINVIKGQSLLSVRSEALNHAEKLAVLAQEAVSLRFLYAPFVQVTRP